MNVNSKLIVGLIVMIALAGCAGALSGDGTDDPAEYVPDNSDFIVHVDMAVMQDEATQNLLDGAADADDDTDVEDREDVFEEFEEDTGLDAREVTTFVAYGSNVAQPGEEEVGFIVYADWDEADVIESIEAEEQHEYTAVTEGDVTVYEPDVDEDDHVGTPTYVAVLEDGTFAIGDEAAVSNAVDVANGDADPLDGELRDVFESMDDGYLTVAYDLDEEVVPDEQAAGGVNFAVYEDVSIVGATYATEGEETVSVRLHMHATSDEAAEDIVDVTQGGLTFYAQELERAAEQTDDEDLEEMAGEIRAIDVDRDGDIVVITYEADVDDLIEFLDDGPADP